MKTNIKTLINQVKKALTEKSSIPAEISNAAYVNNNGDIIAHDLNNRLNAPDYNIVVFIGGIVQDLEARNKLYNKDALTLAADTGVFKGGYQLPEAWANYYDLPNDYTEADYEEVVTIPADDLKAAAYTVSGDKSRPVLCNIHIDTRGYIESVDGFRAYRKKCNTPNTEALTDNDIKICSGLMIPGHAAAYGLKGDVTIYNTERVYKMVDSCGLTLYVSKLSEYQGHFINLDTLYTYNTRKNAAVVTISKTGLKELTSVLKTAAGSKDDRGNRGTIILRARKNNLDYFIPGLEIFGSIEAATEATAPDYYIEVNPKFLIDAIINQGGNVVYLPDSKQAPVFCNDPDGDISALCLPIRGDRYYPFEKYDQELKQAAEKEAEAIRALNEKQHAENHYTNIGEKEIEAEIERQEAEAAPEAPVADPEKPTPTEAATPEKLEIVKREEITPPEVVKARSIYKQLKAANFTPTTYQEAEAEAIYKNNREKLQPIARRAGGLYIDTLAIIAAVMTIPDELI